MLTIERKHENFIQVQLMDAGKPVALAADASYQWGLITINGAAIGPAGAVDTTLDGTNLAKGQLIIQIDAKSGVFVSALTGIQSCYLWVQDGHTKRYVFEVQVTDGFQLTRSQLFVKEVEVNKMRENQLLVAASGAMREVNLTDDYIWSKLRAAESEVAHTLRILLTPHQVFPKEPTEDEIAALNGMPYLVETPYDYSPQMYDRDKWGYFMTRQRPIISVQRLRFQLPSQDSQFFDIPLGWLKLDEKYGHVRLLPTTNASLVTSSLLGFTALTWQSIIPNMLNLTYQAGLKNAHEDYPELLDAIRKMAVVKILTDLFLPQSGSISADGLSESMSTDVSKYQEQVDKIMNGQDGNGGLMALFNGIRAIVI